MGSSKKKREEKLNETPWNLDRFQEYFQREGKEEGNSKWFKGVIEALDNFSRLQEGLITKESAVKMIGASEQLKKACGEYMENRGNAKSTLGRERLDMVNRLAAYRESLNLDQARDLKVVRDMAGKTWKQAGRFEMAEIRLETEKVTTVGAAVNERMKVDYNGKTGFFTSEFIVRSVKGVFEENLNEMDSGKKEIKDVLKRYQKEFVTLLENVANGDAALCQFQCDLLERWNQMDEKEPERKELTKICSSDGLLYNAAYILAKYHDKLNSRGEIDDNDKRALLDETMRECLKEDPEGLKELNKEKREALQILSQHKEFLMEARLPGPDMTKSEKQTRYFKMEILRQKAKKVADPGMFNSGKKDIRALDSLLKEDKMLRYLAGALDKERSAGKAIKDLIGLNVDSGVELTTRNIATTRMAELLGVGRIVARSEKMRVQKGEKLLVGCFMEYADGVDLFSGTAESNSMANTVRVRRNADFNRDISTIEIFDYLCGQGDRHEANMFYKLSEADAEGKRYITGLQGIDNDLSFGNLDKTKASARLEHMIFIDDKLAEIVGQLKKEDLEYALGDLIPEPQINIMMERVEKFQKHMNANMVTIKSDGWDLKEYDVTKGAEDTDERGKRYVNGLKDMERSDKKYGILKNDDTDWFYRNSEKEEDMHKDRHIKGELKKIRKGIQDGKVPITLSDFEKSVKEELGKQNSVKPIKKREVKQTEKQADNHEKYQEKPVKSR